MNQDRRLQFAKMEGAGNDYVYVADFAKPMLNPDEIAIAVSDRHFGIGGDGLVLIGPSSVADFRMRMFNADGSEGEMCGNAIRCVGKYVYDKGLTDKTTIAVETLAGLRVLDLTVADKTMKSARVAMGLPILAPRQIPVDADGETFIDQELVVEGATWRATAVSMGNPHIVIPVPSVAALDLAKIGPSFEHHKLFPKRINTEFVEVLSRDAVRMRVWERGSGETLACGTGACATAVACCLNGWTDRTVTVHLTGGDLLIEWDEPSGMVFMSGPARLVFEGEYILPDGIQVKR